MRKHLLVLCAFISLPTLVIAAPDSNEVYWELGVYEGMSALKESCAQEFPQYFDDNEAAFQASPYSKATEESIIDSMAIGEPKKRELLNYFPQIGKKLRAKYDSMSSSDLESRCKAFPETLAKLSRSKAQNQDASPQIVGDKNAKP